MIKQMTCRRNGHLRFLLICAINLAVFQNPFCRNLFAVQSDSQVRFSARPYIFDESGIPSDEQREALSDLLTAHNQAGSGRIFVLIIKDLPSDRTIEAYARLKINEEDRLPAEPNDRILILIAIQNREIRIETSQDVWSVLPDSYCRTVIMQIMAPNFKRSDYYSGVHSAIEELSNKLRE